MARLLWTQKQDIGPTSRSRFGLAYDSVRKNTYLFGGGSVVEAKVLSYTDTWAWDGEFWTQVARFGPPAQDRPAMAFDTARGNTVLFGFGTDEKLGATWVFDGAEWTQVEDIGPSRRFEHAVAYDSPRQRIVLFGGRDVGGVGDVNDTWEWDGIAWTEVADTGPSAKQCRDELHRRSAGFARR